MTMTATATPNPAAGETMPHLQAPPPRVHRPSTVVCDVEGGLLRSSSCFPYFMAVALEGGGLLRALLLLLLHPVLSFLSEETSIRAMTLICFCGVSVSSFRVGAVVLPKHLLGDVGREGFHLLMAGERKVCLSRMPRVMVEEFVRKYLGVEVVIAREIKVAGGYYTGFMEDKMAEEENALLEKEEIDGALLGFTAKGKAPLHPLFSRCREVVAVSEQEKAGWRQLPREEYPEALVFHDGRLAFRPTPLAAAAMFVWLPIGCLLPFIRAVIFIFMPYGISTAALAFTGMKNRVVASPFTSSAAATGRRPTGTAAPPGRLFVCNHRTLLDPIFISAALRGPVIAVVHGVAAISQMLSPIRTVMLKRTREEDKAMIAAELRRGDVALCPEGTTCREPFLLRFSPLFAELADEVHPVALSSEMSMFYSAGGTKFMDLFFVLMNPYTLYTVEFLESVSAGERRSSRDTANRIQKAIAAALGFRCTMLTRKDKYQTLAGNDGVVHRRT